MFSIFNDSNDIWVGRPFDFYDVVLCRNDVGQLTVSIPDRHPVVFEAREGRDSHSVRVDFSAGCGVEDRFDIPAGHARMRCRLGNQRISSQWIPRLNVDLASQFNCTKRWECCKAECWFSDFFDCGFIWRFGVGIRSQFQFDDLFFASFDNDDFGRKCVFG